MDAATVRQITLYMRPSCYLCEDAAELLERLALRYPLAIREVSILSDVGLYERYRYRVPVVVCDGGPVLEAPIREEALLQWLGVPCGLWA